MNRRVAITGMGVISAIGKNVAENYFALTHNKTGIAPVKRIHTIHNDILLGEVKYTSTELQQMMSDIDWNALQKLTRTGILGLYAIREALAQAQIADINEFRTGFINATDVGGMDVTENYFLNFEEQDADIQDYIHAHDMGAMTNVMAAMLGLKGMVTTISTACSSAANAMMLGARLINSGRLDRVIVGGTESLSRFTINGFKTLMIFSDAPNRPFDEHRKGLNLGEGAGYLILESENMIQKSGKEVIAYLSGWGNANDAFHQTASSDEGIGATLAMQQALQVAGLHATDIDYINAHGTATPNNDFSESQALMNVFGDQLPPFSSTKPFTGHTLAASAGIESVYSILALQNQILYPNLNFDTPMSSHPYVPLTSLQEAPIQHVLSNAFGFGGNCSSLIFSKA